MQAEVLCWRAAYERRAQVPSGASTGRHEALELRDGDAGRYAGKGVARAVENVERILGPAVMGMDGADQAGIDERLVQQGDRVGANATLAISCAGGARRVDCKAGCRCGKYLAGGRSAAIPVPMVNIISGGLHAGRNIEFQDFSG